MRLFFCQLVLFKFIESRNYIYYIYNQIYIYIYICRNPRGSPIDVRQRTGRTPRDTRPLFISARLLVRCIILTFLDRVDRCCNYTSDGSFKKGNEKSFFFIELYIVGQLRSTRNPSHISIVSIFMILQVKKTIQVNKKNKIF